ncbi:GntR family transcriptional regulator [Hahella sp. CCB-MM4]|uniref:aminotransferase-like domain-containing protein n=1 Tax=Hahella sp. (strain CCB-MM4) TaxID=1926491 RepID=UPI000B9C20C0|nr:PLP-dependent aminotransferase family protein [Hahella sp. CCB-MM4]OZG74192.1 GntR family transcriptional regulator [Hahella sp. CCB-MM4]
MSEAKYLEIARRIESLIDIGHYAVGSKLPTHRALADEFNTTPVTIAKAYKVLAENGRIESFVGRGSFVRDRSQLKQVIQSHFADNEWNFSILQPCYADHLESLHTQLKNSFDQLSNPGLYGYTEDTGFSAHREAGFAWMQKFGLRTGSAEQTLLTNGAQHALSTLIELYTKPGDRIALEAQTYPGILSIASFLGRQPVAVAMDEYGMLPESLNEVCREYQPAMVIIIPSHQNPTGATMSEDRRRTLASVIQRHPLWLVEDDIYGFLNESPVTPVTDLIPEKSFYISSLSKAISPGLRCGYIKAPQNQVSRLASFIRATVWLASPLMFEVASHLIMSGTAIEMANKQRDIARHRQEIARHALSPYTLSAQKTSFHIWLSLPGNWQADQFTLTAKERGLLVSSGSYFSVDLNQFSVDLNQFNTEPGQLNVEPRQNNAIRLSLMAIADEGSFREGLRELATLLKTGKSGYLQF